MAASKMKEVLALVAEIRGWDGWTVETTRDGYVATPPVKSMRKVYFHTSPSDHRWKKNIYSQLRKSGAPI